MSLSKPRKKFRKISTKDYKIKEALARHLNKSFERMPNLAGHGIKVMTLEIQKCLEDEFHYSMLTKKNFIDRTITSLILSGSFQQNGLFSCGMEWDENEMKNVDPEDEFVFAYPKFEEPKNALPQNINSISDRVLTNAVTNLVRAAVKAKEEVRGSIIKKSIEKKYACDLTLRKDFIMEIIQKSGSRWRQKLMYCNLPDTIVIE